MQANEADKKFTAARLALKKGDILKCLTRFQDALQGLGTMQAAPIEKEVLEGNISALQSELTADEGFRKVFGPVTFADADTDATAAFLGELIKVYGDQIMEGAEKDVKAPAAEVKEPQVASDAGPEPEQPQQPVQETPSMSPEARVEEIMMHIGRGQVDEAKALIGGDEDILTRVVRRLNGHGISCRKAGCLDEAINSFESAVLVCDDDEGLFFNLTRSYMESGRMEQAVQTITQALVVNPEFGEGKALLEKISGRMAA